MNDVISTTPSDQGGNNFLNNYKMLNNEHSHGALIGLDLYFCLSDSFFFQTHLFIMSREKQWAQSASWQLEMLIPLHERGLTVHWGRGPHQFVYSVIIWSRHLDCVLAEHQRPCRDCRAARQLHWPLICMNSKPNDRWTYGVWLQKRATSRKYLKVFPQSSQSE